MTLLSQIFLNNMDDKSIAKLIQNWKKSESFDLLAPFGEYPTFLHAWIHNMSNDFFKKIGPITLNEIWSTRVQHFFENEKWGQCTLFYRYITFNIHHRQFINPASHWYFIMNNASKNALLNWNNSNQDDKYNHLWISLLDLNDEMSLKIWIDKGLPVTGPVWKFNQPFLWETFLKQGGDPYLKNEEGEAEWEKGLKIGSNIIKEQIRTWASEKIPSDLQEKDLEKYWNTINQKYNVVDIKKALRAYPKWEELKDENGFTPFTVAFLKNASIFSEVFTSKKIAKLTLTRDNKGRNFWFPLLSKSKTINSSMLDWGLKNLPIDDVSGEGWLSWIKDMSQHEAFPIGSLAVKLLEKIPSKIWLPSSEEKQKELAQFLLENIWWGSKMASARIHNFLAYFHRRWDGIHPDLEKVFAISVLLSTNLDNINDKREEALKTLLKDDGFISSQLSGKHGQENFEFLKYHFKSYHPDIWDQMEANEASFQLKISLPLAQVSKKSNLRI